jgi:hypothetical protein
MKFVQICSQTAGVLKFSHIASTMGGVVAARAWIVMENQCLVATAPAVQQIARLDFAHNLDLAAMVKLILIIELISNFRVLYAQPQQRYSNLDASIIPYHKSGFLYKERFK